MEKITQLTTVAVLAGTVSLNCAPALAQNNPVKPPGSAVQKPGNAAISKEVSEHEQEKIYQSQGDIVPAEYVIDRSLLSYTITLLSGFDQSLAELGTGDRWLDIGAGEGQAILDYYGARYDAMHPEGREKRGKKARTVGVSIEDRRTTEWHQTAANLEPDKIKYFYGKPLREYSREELGRFQVATDVYGGFSYTPDLSLFMEKVLDSLEPKGVFYTLLIDVHPETWTKRPARPRTGFQTEIINADDSEMKVCSWLKRITCVEVVCEQEEKWDTPIERYRIQKTCNDVKVPALTSVHFSAGTPPARRFQISSPSQASPGQTSKAR